MTATPCIIAVPSIFIVAPKGIVNEDIFLFTPIFLLKVSIDIGIVAFDVAVENANPITGANFLINFTGFKPVNPFNNNIYTTKHCNPSAINTLTIYFNIGTKASNPIVAKVLDIKQNTPIGATFITIIVISIIISLNCAKNLATTSTLLPSFARIIPTIIANKIICNMFPSANP